MPKDTYEEHQKRMRDKLRPKSRFGGLRNILKRRKLPRIK